MCIHTHAHAHTFFQAILDLFKLTIEMNHYSQPGAPGLSEFQSSFLPCSRPPYLQASWRDKASCASQLEQVPAGSVFPTATYQLEGFSVTEPLCSLALSVKWECCCSCRVGWSLWRRVYLSVPGMGLLCPQASGIMQDTASPGTAGSKDKWPPSRSTICLGEQTSRWHPLPGLSLDTQ